MLEPDNSAVEDLLKISSTKNKTLKRVPMAKVARLQGHSVKFTCICDNSSCNPLVSNITHMLKTLVFIHCNCSCFLFYLEENFNETLNDRAELGTFSRIATVNVYSVKKKSDGWIKYFVK